MTALHVLGHTVRRRATITTIIIGLVLSAILMELSGSMAADSEVLGQFGGTIGDAVTLGDSIVFSVGPRLYVASLVEGGLNVAEASEVLPAPVSDIDIADGNIVIAMQNAGIARFSFDGRDLRATGIYVDDKFNFRSASHGGASYVAANTQGIKIVDWSLREPLRSAYSHETDFDVRDVVIHEEVLYAVGIVGFSNTVIQSFLIEDDLSLSPISRTETRGSVTGEVVVDGDALLFAKFLPTSISRVNLADPTDLSVDHLRTFDGYTVYFAATSDNRLIGFSPRLSGGGNLFTLESVSDEIEESVWLSEPWLTGAVAVLGSEIFVVDRGFGIALYDSTTGSRAGSGVEMLANTELCAATDERMLATDGTQRVWHGVFRDTSFELVSEELWREAPNLVEAEGDTVVAVSSEIDMFRVLDGEFETTYSVATDVLNTSDVSALDFTESALMLLTTETSRSGAVRTLTEINRDDGSTMRSMEYATASGGGNTRTTVAARDDILLIADGLGGLITVDVLSEDLNIVSTIKSDVAISNVVIRGDFVFASAGSLLTSYRMDRAGLLEFTSSIGLAGEIHDMAVVNDSIYLVHEYRRVGATRARSAISTVSIEDPTALSVVGGRIETPGKAVTIDVLSGNAYVCSADAGVVVVNLTEDSSPESSVWLPQLWRN